MATLDQTVLTIQSVNDRIRDLIEDCETPDSYLIALEVRDSLDSDELEAALLKGLELQVTKIAGSLRREANRRAHKDALTEQVNSDREEAIAQLDQMTVDYQKLKEERFFQTWKETKTGRKFLGECTSEDLRYSRDQQQKRSDELLKASVRDEYLATILDSNGCETVRDLGYSKASRAYLD